ncbi:MAG: flavin reductase family protein [Clostridia bacterium]|nr:flavin reductase family protein [Clostridia bacterium]
MDKSALFKLSYGLYVIGVQKDEGFGGCVVDAFMHTTEAPPTAVLCCMQRSLTNTLIKEHRVFTISVLPTDVDPLVIANFGFQSARSANKWAHVEHRMHGGLPALTHACAGLLLRATDFRELSTHTLFFCDIEDGWIGQGDPLLYGEYQRVMKPATLAAFQALKQKQQSTEG